MCFCVGEYLKLTFIRVVFVAWYMRLFFYYFLVSRSVLEVGTDSWFLTYMSRRIDFCWILESLNLNDVLIMSLRYVFRTSQMSLCFVVPWWPGLLWLLVVSEVCNFQLTYNKHNGMSYIYIKGLEFFKMSSSLVIKSDLLLSCKTLYKHTSWTCKSFILLCSN